ncbi:MAG: hypothetical protein JW778_00470 [Candidatus Altiarchaeota archaeon]|nr:hypothetical protein [Candidatus Altiarchaeota archaeon]
MPLDLKKEIGNNKILVLVIPNDTYTECVIELSKQVGGIYGKTCYVSLNKLFTALLNSLKNNGVNTEGFFFIDAITKSALPGVENTFNCNYISSASSLQELAIAINNELNKEDYEALIFDSLSTLQIYNREDVITEFIKYMMARVRLSNCVAILTCLEGDTDSQLIRNLAMFSDKIIHIEAHIIMEDTETTVTFEARGSTI